MGKVVSKKKFEYYEYVTAVMMSIGMVMFLLNNNGSDKGKTWLNFRSQIFQTKIYYTFHFVLQVWKRQLSQVLFFWQCICQWIVSHPTGKVNCFLHTAWVLFRWCVASTFSLASSQVFPFSLKEFCSDHLISWLKWVQSKNCSDMFDVCFPCILVIIHLCQHWKQRFAPYLFKEN